MVMLNKLKSGASAKLVKVEGGTNLKERLYNLGLKEGMELKKITSTAGKGPVVVKFGRIQIAIGIGMASKMVVDPL